MKEENEKKWDPMASYEEYKKQTRRGNIKTAAWAILMFGVLGAGRYYIDNLPDTKGYPSIVYEDVGDSLRLYVPKEPSSWHYRAIRTQPDDYIGIVAKEDVRYKNNGKSFRIAAQVKGEKNPVKQFYREKTVDDYAINSELTESSFHHIKVNWERAKKHPDFEHIKKLTVYQPEDTDLFFGPARTE